jgi:uncharacterized protein
MDRRVLWCAAVGFGMGVLSASTSAASFDCDQDACNRYQQAIFDDPALSKLDDKMATLFYECKNQGSTSLLVEQKDWIAERNRECGVDLDCLAQSFKQRIVDLRQRINDDECNP